MDFVKAALKKEIPAGKMKAVDVAEVSVLLANIADEYYAIGNKCTHRGCKLSSGTLDAKPSNALAINQFSTLGPAKWCMDPHRSLNRNML
jgi:phenylpropionate dioxygenase-like ring-hydroxylating dioxygenase large terminal subunit